MNIHNPVRQENETQEAYKARRQESNAAAKAKYFMQLLQEGQS